ncbi:MAG TPA: DUF3021 domain-containing protein [Mogibacterium sp.]|nr:DUF3021 domain-containing protein [Mogibacterium sp.]
MENKKHNLLLSTVISIGIAAAIFCLFGVIFDLAYKGNFKMENYAYTKMVIGTLVIGLGFGLPTLVYDNDKMSVRAQSLIHMGIGCIVMTITAFAVGWIPTEYGILTATGIVLAEIVVALIIWMFFYSHNKKIAKQMNERINELNS